MKQWMMGCVLTCVIGSADVMARDIYLSPDGNDANAGTLEKPLKSPAAAQRAARARKAEGVTVYARGGTYYLPEALVFTPEDSGSKDKPVVWQAYRDEQPVISGGTRLELKWETYRDGIMKAATPAGLAMDRLFVNGQCQLMARYPNYTPGKRPYGGCAADSISKERAAKWADPAGGYIHALHGGGWGGYHYRITGKDAHGELTYEGGWQNNRRSGMSKQRFVENIFEELDAHGEWFHDAKTHTLYYYPPAGLDLQRAVVEVSRLRNLMEFRGASHIAWRGFTFRHAARTFMDTKEPLLRSDWTIYRGGALLFNGATDCSVEDCEFDQAGGNAIFVSSYNRRLQIKGCDIHDTGGSAVAFVGGPGSVRSPLFEYGQRQGYDKIDKTPGPLTDQYPSDCVVEDCLIRNVGTVEKQVAGVQLSMSMRITVRHCSIYDCARAGINISEGTFGGHLIEFCDVFDTVLETKDHGSFNSWGRDRYWHMGGWPRGELPKLALLDAAIPTVLRNNRWRCDYGWDVDLDDGSSNYEIYNNVFLQGGVFRQGGLKLREGFYRRVWNNIAINCSFHPHVWFPDSGDVVTNNIWMTAYQPAGGMPKDKWGSEIDRNLFLSEADRTKFASAGCDIHSLVGDPLFMNAAQGDYRVKEGSPALQLGFKNFPMDQFGVQKPSLKKAARRPQLPEVHIVVDRQVVAAPVKANPRWLGAEVKGLEGEEYSAFGVSKASGGINLVDVPPNSAAAKNGFRSGDLIQSVQGKPAKTVADLLRLQTAAAGQAISVGIVRDQKPQTLKLTNP